MTLQVTRNAIGLRCYDNLASHCQPGEIQFNRHCYRLVRPESRRNVGRSLGEISEQCKTYGGRLLDVTTQVNGTSFSNPKAPILCSCPDFFSTKTTSSRNG